MVIKIKDDEIWVQENGVEIVVMPHIRFTFWENFIKNSVDGSITFSFKKKKRRIMVRGHVRVETEWFQDSRSDRIVFKPNDMKKIFNRN